MGSRIRVATTAVLAVALTVVLAGCSRDGGASTLPETVPLPAPSSGTVPGGDVAAAEPWRSGAVEPPHSAVLGAIPAWRRGEAHSLLTAWPLHRSEWDWDSSQVPEGAGVPVVRLRGLEDVRPAGSRGRVNLLVTDGCSGAIVSYHLGRTDERTLEVLESHLAGGYAADCAGPYAGLDLEQVTERLLWVAQWQEPTRGANHEVGLGSTWLLSDSVGNPLVEFEGRPRS